MKTKLFRMSLPMLAAPALVLPGTAHAQIWIGQIVGDMIAQGQAAAQEHACMSGTAMPDNEVVEARQPSAATMSGYFAAAKSRTGFAGAFNLDKRSRWTSGATSAGMAQIGSQPDPFAIDGLMIDAAPTGFVRAGDAASAHGQWAVRDSAGALRGTYDAIFTRRTGIWRLSTLTLVPVATYIDPVVQFCHKPGDVMPYRLNHSRMMREIASRRVAKAEAKAQNAVAAAATAQARSSKGGAGGATQAVQVAETRAAQLTEALAARRRELSEAEAVEQQALADAKAAEDAKAAAIAALGRTG